MAQPGFPPAMIRALLGADRDDGLRVRSCPQRVRRALYDRGFTDTRRDPQYLNTFGDEARSMLLDIAASYRKGTSSSVLGRRYGFNARTILRWLVVMEVPVRRNGTKITPEQRAEMAALYRQGSSTAALSARFDVTTHPIRKALRREGVALRPPGHPPAAFHPARRPATHGHTRTQA